MKTDFRCFGLFHKSASSTIKQRCCETWRLSWVKPSSIVALNSMLNEFIKVLVLH